MYESYNIIIHIEYYIVSNTVAIKSVDWDIDWVIDWLLNGFCRMDGVKKGLGLSWVMHWDPNLHRLGVDWALYHILYVDWA